MMEYLCSMLLPRILLWVVKRCQVIMDGNFDAKRDIMASTGVNAPGTMLTTQARHGRLFSGREL